ncbi:2-dehydropantoate 2-reductase (Ketopantoate reductase) (KPA reductase) (KPR) [Dispira simplex]|nr:2-dehydropantoate 2-reductase (Ketopantoate reductase) (KPA reductase) (KPR) [Dispira simplex]
MVYILGVGAIGTLVAYHLRHKFPTLPVTLLLRNQASAEKWQQVAQEQLTLVKPPSKKSKSENGSGNPTTAAGPLHHVRGFSWEVLDSTTSADAPAQRIDCLVVTTKVHHTTEALRQVVPRLDHRSVVLLLQNGMGVYEEIRDKFYSSPCDGEYNVPLFLQGTTTHGCYRPRPFHVVHAGQGRLWLGTPDIENAQRLDTSSTLTTSVRTLLSQFRAIPLGVSWESTFQLQARLWQKLAVNGCINPLTAHFDCLNGALLDDMRCTSLIHALCTESSVIIRHHLDLLWDQKARGQWSPTDELALIDVPLLQSQFTPDALVNQVQLVCRQTANNVSSMRQDIRAGRPTEINYINGYLVTLATRYNLPCSTHRQVLQWFR